MMTFIEKRMERISRGIHLNCAEPVIWVFIFFAAALTSRSAGNAIGTCTTKACEDAAYHILFNMNKPDLDPCEDFYEFACGDYRKRNYLKPDSSGMNIVTENDLIINDNFYTELRNGELSRDIKPMILAKRYYQSCLGIKNNLSELSSNVKQTVGQLGDWPVLTDAHWKTRELNLTHTMFQLRKLGFTTDYILDIDVGIIPSAYDRYKPIIAPSKVSHVHSDKDFEYAMQFMLGPRYKPDPVFMQEIRDFQTQLNQVSQSNRNLSVMSISQLTKRYRSIPWLDYIRTMLNNPKVKLCNKYRVGVTSKRFLYRLDKLFTYTPKRMGVGVAVLYARTYMNVTIMQSVSDMTDLLQSSYMNSIINNMKWMDAPTRNSALEKQQQLLKTIGYPKEFLDDIKLLLYYDPLRIGPNDSYIKMKLSIDLFNTNKKYEVIGKKKKRTAWYEYSAIDTIAKNDVTSNAIWINPGLFTKHFFDLDLPAYKNYAGMGMIIAQSMMQSIDRSGAHYDEYGKRVNWWSTSANYSYTQNSQCFVQQYSSYIDPDTKLPLNGVNTEATNIADNEAVNIAYLAYRWATERSPPQSLPQLEKYSSDQMFWISMANNWCELYQLEEQRRIILNDKHTIGRFRTIGSLSNNENFIRDFECYQKSPMNRANKCKM